MSLRLGAALAEYMRRTLTPGQRNFVLVEGVPTSVAEGMHRAWDDGLPRLAVVSPHPKRFGASALSDVSGTQLRNDPGNVRGMVLVLCDGEQVPDRQSLYLFESVSPSDLLDSAEGLRMLSQVGPPVDLDGPARAVREAIVHAGVGARPSAAAVASYFDRLAAGDDPLSALPTLGAFTDQVASGERLEYGRVADNLALAARRTSDELLSPTGYADLRKRAENVLRRRPGLSGKTQLAAAVEEVMGKLQAGSAQLLGLLRFDEAREILEQRPEDLGVLVRGEMGRYRAGLVEGSQAHGLPWNIYEKRADELGHGARPRQQEAARELCGLDDAQQRLVFTKPTRRKLERLLRDKSVSGSNPSCPEAAIVRAAQQLGGMIERVQVLSPALPAPNSAAATNRSGAGRILTVACARLRLGGLLHLWDRSGGEVDGLLLRAADDDDLGDLQAAFGDAGLENGQTLPPLQLRLHDRDGGTVQVDWKPDLDDAALLRAALVFAEAPALTLTMGREATLHAFCGAELPGVEAVPAPLGRLARALQGTAREALERGVTPELLAKWTQAWTRALAEREAEGDTASAESLTLAGAVRATRSAALTGFAPLKAEWLTQYLQALWALVNRAEEPDDETEPAAAVAAANGVARTTAAHYPAHLRLRTQDRALLPATEGRVWSLYGGQSTRDESGHAAEALHSVLTHLLTLQPEAAGHLRCLAWGPGAADLLVSEATRLIGTRAGSAIVGQVEIFCVGTRDEDRPRWATLAAADDDLRGERHVLQLRYLDDLPQARAALRPATPDQPVVHLALVTGLTEGGQRLQIESPEVEMPAEGDEVLFAPRVWQRPRQDRRTLLMPPAATAAYQGWLRLQNAVEDGWPEPGGLLRVPEVRTGTLDIREQLEQVHDLALWVATLDRYATRDSLEQALGKDNVAILHQEKRLGGDSPLSLVLSQKSGGPADRAIGRSLRAARIVDNADVAFDIGTELRKVASQGYGILALQAATSGAGINELVGHVVAFSMLATAATPWPLPPGCRVLLVNLDEYRHWFPGKRADLLALALDTREGGVHVATIEVKARRSDETDAAAGALDQLNQTLAATRWAAYPDPKSIHSRLWLNRIAEAAYAVARESRFRLDADELAALEAFRVGAGSLEWAGVGLVFGPNVEPSQKIHQNLLGNDIVPVTLQTIRLTEELLRQATATDLTTLRTVETDRPPLQGNRQRRRPEAKAAPGRRGAKPASRAPEPPEDEDGPRDGGGGTPRPGSDTPQAPSPTSAEGRDTEAEHAEAVTTPEHTASADPDRPGSPTATPFAPPVLGWDAASGEEIRWHPAGPDPNLLNGHVEVWGSSGMGKTQFVMTLLAQLARHSGSRFGIADFKNDYSGDTGFPAFSGAEFLDLWEGGAPYNPLALLDDGPRAIDTAVIELRDTVDEATRSFTRMGVRQKAKLEKALYQAYKIGKEEGRWPTLRTLDDQLDADLAGVMGDLTRHELFQSGEPLGHAIDRNLVFGLSKIPGNGQTTVLAAGFILSALWLRMQNLPPVPNTIRYLVVIDEAHRVAAFKAVGSMIREGRSRGLAVVLATQQPLDLGEVVAANAQTKICFGLPDATVAAMAARKLEPGRPRLAEQIRTLGAGEAFVSLRGEAPRLVRMAQAYRDADRLGLPPLQHPS